MIEGAANENLEVTIRLNLHSISGETQDIEAIVDTGFTGHSTLPIDLIEHLALSWLSRGHALLADRSLHLFDVYIGTLTWNGQARTVEVDEAETDPLVGMRLLGDHNLSVDVVEGGNVRIEPLA